MPFLTDLDSRAAVKGSRDPLGLVPVWSRFGRHVVGNLTTVSNSVRGFTTLLLGYYFAEQVKRRGGTEAQSTLDPFLKFEQLAGYSRWHVNRDGDFRGRDRVVARLQERPRATLGSDPSCQILGNQRTYGLWGLFSVPARSSGLLADDEEILTPVAREFVEAQYIARLTSDGHKDGRPVVELLRRQNADVALDGRDAALARSIASILAKAITPAERRFYDRFLVNGGEQDRTHGCQPLLADVIASMPSNGDFGMGELREATRRAAKLPDGGLLATRLEAIEKIEALLVPMESAFGFLLTRDRQPLASVAAEMGATWGRALRHVDPAGVGELRPTLLTAFHQDERAAARFIDIATTFSQGAYEDSLGLLLEHSAFVMEARNGSQPWARLDAGKVDVQYRDESGELIPGNELPDRWRSTYFINSLHTVVTTLRAA
jgi:hypothetical protein